MLDGASDCIGFQFVSTLRLPGLMCDSAAASGSFCTVALFQSSPPSCALQFQAAALQAQPGLPGAGEGGTAKARHEQRPGNKWLLDHRRVCLGSTAYACVCSVAMLEIVLGVFAMLGGCKAVCILEYSVAYIVAFH